MSLVKIHDNWPEWMVRWLEQKVSENQGKYTLTIESPRRNSKMTSLGRVLGSELAKKREKEILELLNGEK